MPRAAGRPTYLARRLPRRSSGPRCRRHIGRLVYIQVLHHDHYVARSPGRAPRKAGGALLPAAPSSTATASPSQSRSTSSTSTSTAAPGTDDLLSPAAVADCPARRCSAMTSTDQLLTTAARRSQRPHRPPRHRPRLRRRPGHRERSTCPALCWPARRKRYYPEGDIGSALLGFLGRDHTGLAGLEADLDDALSGTPGALYFERDGGGQPIAFGADRDRPRRARLRRPPDHRPLHPAPGRERARLPDQGAPGQRRHHHRHGPEDRRDPRRWPAGPASSSRSCPSRRPTSSLYRNRAVTDLYEPGSVMKT